MESLVSVLIPAYNAQETIAATLQSSIAQTWPRKEVIVVDDGSTDNTLAIARRFQSGSVQVLTQANQGAAAARNKAFSLCQGDYIQWLDADDLLARDKIAKQMEVANCVSKRTLLSSSWGQFFYRPTKTRFVSTALWKDLDPADWLIKKLGENLWMSPQSWLVSRQLSELVGPWDARLSADDDGEYFSRLVAASDRIKFVSGAISYKSSGNATSLSKNIHASAKKRRSQFESICKQIEYLRSIEDSVRARAACVKCLQRWLVVFYPEDVEIVVRAKGLARELGGELVSPELGWKWDWIRQIFGLRVAKTISLSLRGTSVVPRKYWDYVLSKLEKLLGICI